MDCQVLRNAIWSSWLSELATLFYKTWRRPCYKQNVIVVVKNRWVQI